jgi:diaminopimelate decarboxylase
VSARVNVAELSVVTHMHVAGSIHADVSSAAPVWLDRPTDANALVDGLWSGTTVRGPGGEMHVGGLPVSDILAQAGSPVYVIDEIDFRGRALTWAQAFAGWKVYYAGKSFLSGTIARWVFEEGLNLDVCSLGELTVALRAGFDPARIGLHGNNKSDDLLRARAPVRGGADHRRLADEIAAWSGSAPSWRDGRTCSSASPPASRRTPTSTSPPRTRTRSSASRSQAGRRWLRWCAATAARTSTCVGLHSHIGSQIFDTNGFEVAARRTLRLMSQFKEATGVTLPELDLGGGFGIAYTIDDSPATPADLAHGLSEIIEHECRAFGLDKPMLSLEPGRAISGPPGTALYTVGTIKDVELGGGQSRRYISVDGGMSDNIRPALYAAEYSAVVAGRVTDAPPTLSRVVGLHCEGGDILVRDVFLPGDVRIGDVIAVPAAGPTAARWPATTTTPRVPRSSVCGTVRCR